MDETNVPSCIFSGATPLRPQTRSIRLGQRPSQPDRVIGGIEWGSSFPDSHTHQHHVIVIFYILECTRGSSFS